MSEQKKVGRAFLDRDAYVKNRSAWTVERLQPYLGEWVAWSSDGSRVVAHDKDPVEVCRAIDAAGIDHEDVVLERIPEEGLDWSVL